MRYVIVAPPYNNISAGIKVLYELQKWLIRFGKDAIIMCFNSPFIINDDDIAVYPEIVSGNPLGARRVVRYILNDPGKLGGDKTYDKDEILVAYDGELGRFSHNMVLRMPCVEDFFTNTHCERVIDCFWVGKGKNSFKFHPVISNALEITYTWPQKRRELAALLNRTKTFYTYDDRTALTLEAALCGCEIKEIKDGEVIDIRPMQPFDVESITSQLNQFIQRTWYPEMDSIREAAEYIDATISRHALTSETLVERGMELKREHRYNDALEFFSTAVNRGETSVMAHIGDCLANLGKTDAAEDAYREAIKTNVTDAIAHTGMGVVKLLSENHTAAAISFSKALKSDPGNSKALCGLGLARTVQGRRSEGFELFKKTLDVEPDNQTALHELLKGAYELDQLAEVEPYLDSYLMYHPADCNILYSLAGLRYRLGNHKGALDSLEKVLTFEPGYIGGEELAVEIRSALNSGSDKLILSTVA